MSQIARPLPSIFSRYYSSGSKKQDEAFNTEVSAEELKKNTKAYEDFKSGKHSSKKHVENSHEGFESLKDKGDKTAKEQDRPDDFMWSALKETSFDHLTK